MNLRTEIRIEPSPFKITYNNKVMLIGSCFAAYMGDRMHMCKMPVMINPSGTVFNPVSVLNALETIISGRVTSKKDLYNYQDTWLSFMHYTDFTSDDPDCLADKINCISLEAGEFLRSASSLLITFGTARVYRLKKTGLIVSNCHKIPASEFENEQLSVQDIAELWLPLLDRLSAYNPKLNVVFTVSPVRHWKDGAHGNQISKSSLFLAIEQLLEHKSRPGYFPAYEILIDELRDYRFYADDMLHPSSMAVEYIWGKFSEAYFDKATVDLQRDILKITRACKHSIITDSKMKQRIFAERMLKMVNDTGGKNPGIDFSFEKEHFNNILRVSQ